MPKESLSFSLQFPDRTVDLAAMNRSGYDLVQGLSALIPLFFLIKATPPVREEIADARM